MKVTIRVRMARRTMVWAVLEKKGEEIVQPSVSPRKNPL